VAIDFQEHYDTPFSGYGQLFDNQNGVELFNDATRCRSKDLCSLTEAGKLSDDREFHAYEFMLEMEFENPSLYDIYTHYVRIELWQQETLKNRIWANRIGAGGGVHGLDNNTSSHHLSNGFPASSNTYKSPIPWVFPPGRTWKLVMRFMQLTGATAGQQPLAIFNADVGGQEQTRKLVRMVLAGKEFSDVIK
jgi:hypothetical protein